MQKFEFSVSLLESYRKYEADEISEDNLLETLHGTKVWSNQMQVGGAIHSIVEHGIERYRVPNTDKVEVTQGGVDGSVVFLLTDLAPVIEFRLHRPFMVHEVPVRLQFQTNPAFCNPLIPAGPYEFTINGRVDIINGNEVEDVKTTEREPDATAYIDSCQWKCYLLATGCNVFRYQVFETHRKKSYYEGEGRDRVLIEPVGYEIEQPMEVSVYRDNTIMQEVIEIANNLVNYLASKGLLHRIQAKPKP